MVATEAKTKNPHSNCKLSLKSEHSRFVSWFSQEISCDESAHASGGRTLLNEADRAWIFDISGAKTCERARDSGRWRNGG